MYYVFLLCYIHIYAFLYIYTYLYACNQASKKSKRKINITDTKKKKKWTFIMPAGSTQQDWLRHHLFIICEAAKDFWQTGNWIKSLKWTKLYKTILFFLAINYLGLFKLITFAKIKPENAWKNIHTYTYNIYMYIRCIYLHIYMHSFTCRQNILTSLF